MADHQNNSYYHRLGIIGGLGPMATAYFLQRIAEMTDAKRDQDHLELILYSVPSIPDRTAYILNPESENPLPPLIEIGQRLAGQNVDCIAIPCVTAHYYYDVLASSVPCPIIHAIQETAGCLAQTGIQKAGIAATDGTLASHLFQNEMEKKGIHVLMPHPDTQRGVMDLVYNDFKAGHAPHMDLFEAMSDDLKKQGAEVIVLGCTELSLIKRDQKLEAGFLDVIDILARSAILSCGGPLNPQYSNLIT